MNQARETSAIPKEYFDNKPKRDRMNLEPYLNKHIAWSWDDSAVAVADSIEELNQRVIAAGHDPARVVFAFVEVEQEPRLRIIRTDLRENLNHGDDVPIPSPANTQSDSNSGRPNVPITADH
jgi:hypothetical protein